MENTFIQFVLVNVVVAVLMKHLEESNSNAAAEDEADAAKEAAADGGAITPKRTTDDENGQLDPNMDDEAGNVPVTIPIISVTEADSDGNKTVTESDHGEIIKEEKSDWTNPNNVKIESVAIHTEPTDAIQKTSPSDVACDIGDDLRYCQINRDDISIEVQNAKNINSKKESLILRQQKAFDEPSPNRTPRIMQHVIYEESSDSDNQQIRMGRNEDRNVKRMGRKVRNHRAHLLHGMRIDSIEDHEGSSSPPYDDTRASESATSLNEFYME